jgi:hypothetical protein
MCFIIFQYIAHKIYSLFRLKIRIQDVNFTLLDFIIEMSFTFIKQLGSGSTVSLKHFCKRVPGTRSM